MKKIKAILGILSAMAIISAVELSSASALTFYPAPPNYVCNGNKVVSDDNTIMEFEDGTKIVTFEGERWDFKLSVIVNDNTEITNECWEFLKVIKLKSLERQIMYMLFLLKPRRK